MCKYKILAALMSVFILLSTLPLSVSAQDEAPIFAWEIESDGTLYITGSGTVKPIVSADDVPWKDRREQIVSVCFDESATLEIESIAYWFSDCVNLIFADIPAYVHEIGYHAFYNCLNLHDLVLCGETPPTIVHGAFITNHSLDWQTDCDPRLQITVYSDAMLNAVCGYDWLADSSPVHANVANPVATFSLESLSLASANAVGSCIVCGQTCAYTVGYDLWDDSCHCLRYWCSNCGRDQNGGVASEAHSISHYDSTYDKCTKCGYQTACTHGGSGGGGGGGGDVCTHGSSYTDWSGCHWSRYCSDCGVLLDSGTNHGTYTYGNWVYDSSSQHRRSYSCQNCGEGSYEYGYHYATNSYSQYDSSQHIVSAYCSTCSSSISSDYENHSFSYGSWESYSSSQHRRNKYCPYCSYSEYSYGNHSDDNGDGKCDTCGCSMSLTVTWDAYTNGGKVNGQNYVMTSVATGSYASAPSHTPTKTGHSFRGWFTTATGSTPYSSTAVTAATTFYAQFTVDSYTVTFNANGGTTSTGSKSVTYASTYGTLPTPTWDGYTFDGWYTKASGGTQITENTLVTATSDHTLYAHWTAKTYTVSFDTNGGSTPTTSKTVTYGKTYGMLPIPTWDGYTFDGWFTEANGGTQITENTSVTVTSDHTLYAHWTRIIVFSVTVPANLSLTVSEYGEVYAADNAAIVNNSTGAVAVTDVTLTSVNGWTLVPYDFNMAAAKVNAKLIGFTVNGAATNLNGASESLPVSSSWTIPESGSLPLTYDAVVSATSTAIQNEQVLTLVFVIEWAVS